MTQTRAAVIRVGLAQVNPRVGDLAHNLAQIEAFAARAEAAGCDLVAFPELTLSGYPPEDLVLKAGFVADNRAALEKVAARSGRCAIVVGFVDTADDAFIEQQTQPSANPPRLFNAAALCANGAVLGVYHKQLLPNYAVFDEARYFAAGHEDATLYSVAGVAVAITICEDIWVSDGPVARARAAGAQLCININGSPFERAKSGERERTVADRARETGMPIAYVNQVCGQDELVFDGGSVVVDSDGAVMARAAHFVEELLVVDVPITERVVAQNATGATTVAVSTPLAKSAPVTKRIAEVANDYDRILAALALGTRDYVHKNGFTDVVLGLSGGIDSALVAAVAVEALGATHVHGVSMPSRYSSDGSQTDAADLARNLGIDMRTIPIEPAFAAYLQMTTDAFAGRAADLTEENLQSRVRGTTLMALSNKFGWMVLTTGNKSELAVGYFTLYGDSVGGFAMIKDIFKTDVYALSQRINQRAGCEIIPAATLTKPPSAELRPDQRDDQSLPPYDVLDAVLALYIEQDRTAAEIIALGHDESLVRRIVRLVDNNEYKRRQLAPGVRVTSKAFGKDRRLPITNSYRG